jgi:hypothetical protein
MQRERDVKSKIEKDHKNGDNLAVFEAEKMANAILESS